LNVYLFAAPTNALKTTLHKHFNLELNRSLNKKSE